MVAIQRVGSILLTALLLAACGSADKAPPPVEETVFRDVAVAPIEKAKNVENVVMEEKRATDEAVDQAERAQ